MTLNLNTLQKHYDKLLPEERLSAMIAALGRDDMSEYMTLGKTAPKGKTFTVRDSHGLLDAFEFAAMWHMISQLGNIAIFNYLCLMDEQNANIEIKDHETKFPIPMHDALDLSARRIVEGAEAWREICKEYNLDPQDALQPLPYIELIETEELMAAGACKIREIATDPSAEIEGYREIIKRKRAEWE